MESPELVVADVVVVVVVVEVEVEVVVVAVTVISTFDPVLVLVERATFRHVTEIELAKSVATFVLIKLPE